MTKTDVVVVGGGPAGLYSSTLLAQSGIRVVVLEEHASAGTPVHCTGVLFADAFDEFGLSRSVILNELRRFVFHAPGGSAFEFETATPDAVVVDRSQLDRELFVSANRAGVQFSESQKVRDICIDDEGVTVFTDCSAFRAHACILACGANYTFQRKFGLGVPLVYMQSAQVEVPAKCLHQVDMHFGSNVAPGGFAWVVPVFRGSERYARVGLMCDTAAGDFFQRFIELLAFGFGALTLAARRKILPLSPIRKTYTDRLLVVGDAAGLVKPTTGGGIYFSLLSARIAADVLRDAFKKKAFSRDELYRYEHLWRDQLGPEIEAQLAMRHLAQKLPDGDIDELFHITSGGAVMRIVKKLAHFNSHRDLILAILGYPATRDLLLQALRV